MTRRRRAMSSSIPSAFLISRTFSAASGVRETRRSSSATNPPVDGVVGVSVLELLASCSAMSTFVQCFGGRVKRGGRAPPRRGLTPPGPRRLLSRVAPLRARAPPMPSYQNYLKSLKSEISEIDVPGLRSRLEGGGERPVVIDVREQDEYAQGYIPGSRWIPRGFLEPRIEDAVPNRDQPIVLYCAGGARSALSARALRELGYTRVESLAGGFTAWKRAGLPFDMPFTLTSERSEERRVG